MPGGLQQPYLNAEVYRDFQTSQKVFNNREFINIHKDGSTIVGESSLTGRIWDGNVQFGESPGDFLISNEKKSSLSAIPFANGVTDGFFLKDSSKILVSGDGGHIHVCTRGGTWSGVTVPGQDRAWPIVSGVCEHDDAILAVGLFHSGDSFVSGGVDNCIKVWDLFSMVAIETYRPAHTDVVSDVACSPTQQNVFLSSSLDGSVALWHTTDIDQTAKEFGSVSCAARCVCWLTEDTFAVGYENNLIKVYNIKQTEESVCCIDFNFPVHKMVYNETNKLLAVCGDSNILKVYQLHGSCNLKLVYEDSRHSKFVRGLCWDISEPNRLYSCGWDGNFFEHLDINYTLTSL